MGTARTALRGRRARTRERRNLTRSDQGFRLDLSRDESGFSLIESMIALGVIFVVVLGLLASLDTGVRGLLTGRQRTGATALAKEVVEQARGANYDDLGHDVAGDATLASDPDVAGSAPNWTYQPGGGGAAEALVGTATPSYPVHTWTAPGDGHTYTVRVYVTAVDAAQGDTYKRLTVAVTWDKEQYATTSVSNEVRLSTYVSRFGVVGGSEVGGSVDVDAGSVTVTGTVGGVDVSDATIFFPFAHGDATDNGLVRVTHGLARSARSELTLGSGSASGCPEDDAADPAGVTAACNGATAQTAADNDGGTALPLRDTDGPTSYGGGTLAAGAALNLSLGSSASVDSKGAAEACLGCSPSVGDVSDLLVYGVNDADGPSSMGMGFAAGILAGALFNATSPGGALATVDADTVAADQKIAATGRLTAPPVELVTLDLGPLGYTAAARVGAVDVTALAEAGPTAAAPSVSGNAVQVTVYDTVGAGLPADRVISFAPGEAVAETASANFNLVSGITTSTVTLETTVTSGTKSTDSQTSGGVITNASASLTNWLTVTVHLTIVQAGLTLADVTVELDYGRLATSAQYEAQ